ncbi:Putative ankyrin repeat-containing domain superfamily [Septoria linicola]|uniref:Ankyrin repeat-containing domain superfamily n=1 Tax=Septoria linicola TaxID=215465 RepID=A0A9Q9AXI7_9PEZI|nr:Putative ankyrin repeat-containing domain superfamily [Septoria linicola]
MSTLFDKDPKPYIWRNRQMVMNPAHFYSLPDNLLRQAQARELMEEIYSVPLDSQTVVADLLANENEDLAPYMFYEAVKSGHAEVKKAIVDSGKVGLGSGPGKGWDDSVRAHQERRAQEVFGFDEAERTAGLRDWLREFNGESNTLMFHAAVAGAKDIILRLLELGIVPSSETNLSLVPLHAACYNGHLDCAKLLVESGMNINCRDEFGGTALMRAAVGGRTEIVRWLLENNARPHFRESREGKYNALEYGAGKDVEIVKMLLEACGWSPTALMGAASFGKIENFELIANKAGLLAPESPEKDGSTPQQRHLNAEQWQAVIGALDRGGSGGNADIIRILLAFIPAKAVEKDDVREALEQSALRATSGNHAEVVKLLLDFRIAGGADKDIVQEQINELLLDAANTNALETVRLLLDNYGADVNYRDRRTQTNALYNAVVKNHAEMVEVLAKEYSADIHQGSGKFANGPTPLWLAIDRQYESATRALLACGGPVESVSMSLVEGETTRVYVSTERTYRAPVKLQTVMNPAWDDEHSTESFLCLEYPDGWPGGVRQRRPDAELKDDRELRVPEDGGFVVV